MATRNFRLQKKGTFLGAYKITGVHGVTQYFSKAAATLQSTDTGFGVNFLRVHNTGAGQMTMELGTPAAPNGSLEVLDLPGGAVLEIEGVPITSVKVTTFSANIFLLAQN